MTESNPLPTKTRLSTRKRALMAVTVLLLVAVGYLLYRTLYPAAPVPVAAPEGSEDQAVVAPTGAKTMDDLLQYVGEQPIPEAAVGRSVAPVQKPRDHILGNAGAAYSVVEYANLTNQFAAIMQPELRKWILRKTDVNWVFRHYPLDAKPQDVILAMQSECMTRQAGFSAFWQFVDAVFARQAQTAEQGLAAAESIGADMEELNNCIATAVTRNRVIEDLRDAQANGGFYTTPSFFFINNVTGEQRFVQGFESLEFFDMVLADMKASSPPPSSEDAQNVQDIIDALERSANQ